MQGWRIICPDGKERHYPYINFGDAECDARVYTRDSVCRPAEHAREASECPQGEHTVIVCEHNPPKPPGGSA